MGSGTLCSFRCGHFQKGTWTPAAWGPQHQYDSSSSYWGFEKVCPPPSPIFRTGMTGMEWLTCVGEEGSAEWDRRLWSLPNTGPYAMCALTSASQIRIVL